MDDKGDTFNSLSWDHALIVLGVNYVLDYLLSTPSLGITLPMVVPMITASEIGFQLPLSGSLISVFLGIQMWLQNFQLPLSGSRVEGGPQAIGAGTAFNSLSRDHLLSS